MTMTMTKTLENISNWRPYELVTFQTFDQSDEETVKILKFRTIDHIVTLCSKVTVIVDCRVGPL